MKNTLYIILLLIFSQSLHAQVPDTLTLVYCHELALSTYPAADRADLLASANDLQQKRLNANYLPQVQLNGQASYQSDVTKVDVEIPSFYIPPPIDMQVSPAPLNTPVPPKDQYRLSLDVNQVIYDGGITSKQKKVELTAYEIERQKLEVELHHLKENINNVYFSIILMQENEKLLIVLIENLNSKLKDVEAAVSHGIALSSDRDVLRAEIIRVEQQLGETSIQRSAFVKMLGELLSEDLPGNITLELPQLQIQYGSFQVSRPELLLYDMQKTSLEKSKDLITSTWMPKLYGFGQLGYGNPGLNMLEDKWSPFYIVGARLNWQLWNGNKNKKDKQILGLQQSIVDKQRETFDKNLNISLLQQQADINKYEGMILQDFEVIELRINIARTASSQYDNGVITSSDLVSRLNEEAQAKLNLEVHKVRLAKAQVDYLTNLGIL